jgi:hypothetical protein
MAHEAELVDEEPDAETPPLSALQLRRPDTPVTLSELAALKGEALEIIAARVQILETLRKASLRATQPEDWVLFKAPEEGGGQIVGYLQDAGADRVRDLWGISVYGISKPEKVATNDPKVFHYVISGSGRCGITRQVLEEVEGGRSSTDDFCRGKDGAELELAVRKAARANLDGNITRELASLKSVPLDEIKQAWEGTGKTIDRCRRGRGFGTRDERVGGASAKAPDVEPPVCAVCGTKGVFRPGKDGRPSFYGCPQYKTHENRKWTVDADKWVAQQQMKAAGAATATQPTAQPASVPAGKVEPPSADEVFGNKSGGREPRQEG